MSPDGWTFMPVIAGKIAMKSTYAKPVFVKRQSLSRVTAGAESPLVNAANVS